jgi:hypothetical protein
VPGSRRCIATGGNSQFQFPEVYSCPPSLS